MGRVSRYRKIKAADPFSKTRGRTGTGKDRDDPVRWGKDDGVSRTFLRRAAVMRGKLRSGSGYDAPRARKRPRPGKKADAKAPKEEAARPSRNKGHAVPDLERLPGESVKSFKARLAHAKHLDIIGHNQAEHRLSSRRKQFLDEKKKLKKLVGKKGKKGKKGKVLRDLEAAAAREDAGAGDGAEEADLPPQPGKRRRKSGAAGAEAAQADEEASSLPPRVSEEDYAAQEEAEHAEMLARKAGVAPGARGTQRATARTGPRPEVAHRPPKFSAKQLQGIAKDRDVGHKTAGQRAAADVLAHKRALVEDAERTREREDAVSRTREAATQAYAALRRRRLEKDALQRELRAE